KRPIKRHKAFFCSQFVASVLEEGKIVKFKIPISLVAPHNLQHLSKFQFVYQGRLKTYTKRNEDKEVYVSSQCRSIGIDRKSTRLNSSHVSISYAVFCLKKKKRKR